MRCRCYAVFDERCRERRRNGEDGRLDKVDRIGVVLPNFGGIILPVGYPEIGDQISLSRGIDRRLVEVVGFEQSLRLDIPYAMLSPDFS